jgi:peptidyl-prolyl cis-trans isomerase SurA
MKKSAILFFFLPAMLAAQQKGELIDKIIAVTGDEITLLSELEATALQSSEGAQVRESEKCGLLENLLLRKLVIHQARLDSVEVADSEVEAEIDRRMNQFLGYFSTVEEFETYYGKSITEWKEEFRDDIRDELLYERERAQLFGGEKVTPSDVIEFYNIIPADSLPLIPQKTEYSQIVIKPQVTLAEQERVRNFLDSIRTDLSRGKTLMSIQASKWSEDPGSKTKGGCYPLQRKGTFAPEYEAAVFNTPEGQYSPVFKTEFGYHFVKVIEKRGDFYEACHILMSPKPSSRDLAEAKTRLDTLGVQLRSGKITFAQAAMKFSTDEGTRNQEGRVINMASGGNAMEAGDVDVNTWFMLEKLKPGETTDPVLVDFPDGSKAYVVYRLDQRYPAHIANLKEDYLMFQNMATNAASGKAMDEWIGEALQRTYVRVDPQFAACGFRYEWTTGQP